MARREAESTVKRGATPGGPEGRGTTLPSADPRGPAPDDTAPDSDAGPAIQELGDFGRYQLLFRLARGGMGTVHVGRLRGAHRFDRLVAIKKLSLAQAGDEDVAAFLAEARVSAQINHPNVVQTLDVGEHEGMPFLVMDLVEGVSLARLLRRLGRRERELEPELTAWIGLQVARGLHAAHELRDVDGKPYGLVHRDVSPENVLLSFAGRVYVADFGVARYADPDRRTQSGVVKGKFAYMSPEQTEAAKLDRRSDVFSLGVVLHECLTGKPLFDGRSVADTIRRIWSFDPPDPSGGRPGIPENMAPIVLRCLARDRDARYATAGAVGDALLHILRREGRLVEESDLARLLGELFPGQREKLHEKIREAIRAADEGRAPEVGRASLESVPSIETAQATPFQDQGTEAHASVTTGPPLERRGPTMWIALGGAAALAVAIWWMRAAPGPVDREQGSAPSAVASPAEERAQPEPPAPSASEAAAPSASAVASAVPAPPPAPIAAPRARASTRPSASPFPAPPPPPAAPKSHKGVPFKSID